MQHDFLPTDVDTNKDGVIDLQEAAEHLNRTAELSKLRSGESPKWFERMDTNKDGLIQPLELDEDYYKHI